MPGVPRFPRDKSLIAMAVGGLALFVVPLVAVRPISDPSPWLHLKVGEFLVGGGRFNAEDPWAPFARGHYEPTQWLPSVVASELYDQWGLPAVAWLKAVGLVAFLLVLMLVVSRTCKPATAVPLAGAAVAASWPWLTERPQLLGFVLLVPAIAAWWWTACDYVARWWLVPLTWVAAMCHGVWAIGPAVGAIVIFGLFLGRRTSTRDLKRLLSVLGLSVAVAACTPLGPRLLLTPFTVGGNGRQFVLEWMPSSIRTPAVALVLVMLASTWLLWIREQKRPPVVALLLFVAAVVLTLGMQRTVPVGAVIAVLLLADAVEAHGSRAGGAAPVTLPHPRTLIVVWVTAALVAAGIAAPVSAARGGDARGVPLAMKPRLDSLPRGARALIYGDLTGWVMFTAPQVRPVFDLRIEQYSPDYVRAYIRAMKAERGWQEFVDSTGTQVALLEQDSPLTAALTEQVGWTVVQRDGRFVLLEPSR